VCTKIGGFMIKQCEVCGREFEAKRVSARYCSGKCRKLAFLSVPEGGVENAKKEVSVPETLSVPVSVPESVRDNPDKDNPYSPDYDLTEPGFRRRNKAWDTFKAQFRADTIKACKRIHAETMRDIEECTANREEIKAACLAEKYADGGHDAHRIGKQRMEVRG